MPKNNSNGKIPTPKRVGTPTASVGVKRLSRSKIDLFMECPRCFYLNFKLNVKRPPGFPFTLNSAVDALLKKEFDIHRQNQTSHPLMKENGLDAIPYSHPNIDIWRNTFKGIEYIHPQTGFTISGAIDDIWIDKDENLMIVDYKATSTTAEITLDAEYRQSYKRQMEVYQWLFRRNGFKISDTSYFVYVNALKDRELFDNKLDFDIFLIPYEGDDSWIEPTIINIRETLNKDKIPQASAVCEYCLYRKLAYEKENV